MKNKTLKIMTIVILTIISLLLITSNVLAAGLNAVITPQASNAATNVTNIAGQVLNIVQIVGVAVATIMLTVLGIKYVSASPNEKAEYKKGMTIYVIGAVLLFGASMLIGVIRNFIS
jgi:predicted membrane channel-forming protein YqfA (hemolysin III family)